MDGEVDPNACFVFVKHLDSENSSFPPHAVDVLSYAVRLVSLVLCRTAPVYSPERLLLLENVLENEKRRSLLVERALQASEEVVSSNCQSSDEICHVIEEVLSPLLRRGQSREGQSREGRSREGRPREGVLREGQLRESRSREGNLTDRITSERIGGGGGGDENKEANRGRMDDIFKKISIKCSLFLPPQDCSSEYEGSDASIQTSNGSYKCNQEGSNQSGQNGSNQTGQNGPIRGSPIDSNHFNEYVSRFNELSLVQLLPWLIDMGTYISI
jgi:hypothetical protein